MLDARVQHSCPGAILLGLLFDQPTRDLMQLRTAVGANGRIQ